MARILNEQGKGQLGIVWGDASKPNCNGFTREELEKIDFDKVDFSEAFADLNVNSSEIVKSLKNLSTDPANLKENLRKELLENLQLSSEQKQVLQKESP